jgi:hypothetical protein
MRRAIAEVTKEPVTHFIYSQLKDVFVDPHRKKNLN